MNRRVRKDISNAQRRDSIEFDQRFRRRQAVMRDGDFSTSTCHSVLKINLYLRGGQG